jgi:hypothetical protein
VSGPIALGLLLYAMGWTVFNTRFVVASPHFLRTNARLGTALAGVGALIIGGAFLGLAL